jgi:hypothetical protein
MALFGTCEATNNTKASNISKAAKWRMPVGGTHSIGLSQRMALNP